MRPVQTASAGRLDAENDIAKHVENVKKTVDSVQQDMLLANPLEVTGI